MRGWQLALVPAVGNFSNRNEKALRIIRRAQNSTQAFGQALKGDLLCLVRAAREQCHQHHQIRQREKPLIRLNSRRFRRPRDESKVPALREIVQVVDANPREVGHLVVGENLLTRFDGNHGPCLSFLSALLAPYFLDANRMLAAVLF